MKTACLSIALAVLTFASADNAEARVRIVEGYDLKNQPKSGVGLNQRDYVHIELRGEIVEGDANRLEELIPEVKARTNSFYSIDLPRVRLYLESDGGNLIEAMKIGRLVRSEMIETVIDVDKSCSSACVFVFAAGVERTMLYGAELGLHRPYFPKELFAGLDYNESQELYQKISDKASEYLNEMGASESLFSRMLSISSKSVRFIDEDEARDFGIAGDYPAFNEWVRARQLRDFGKDITE